MLFRRKGRIRKEEDERLLSLLDEVKNKLIYKREMVNKSVDPSPLVLHELNLIEAKYLFLLREARIRQTKKNGKD